MKKINYTTAESPTIGDDTTLVTLGDNAGKFAGVTYNYEHVKFEEEGGECRVKFNYNVKDTMNIDLTEPSTKQKFESTVSNVLHHLLLELNGN